MVKNPTFYGHVRKPTLVSIAEMSKKSGGFYIVFKHVQCAPVDSMYTVQSEKDEFLKKKSLFYVS